MLKVYESEATLVHASEFWPRGWLYLRHDRGSVYHPVHPWMQNGVVVIEVILIVLGVLVAIFVAPLVIVVSFGVLWFVVFGPIVAVLLGFEAICKRANALRL